MSEHPEGLNPPSPPAFCLFCGEPERVEIAEIWSDSNFLLDTCCPGLLTSVADGMEDDPVWGRNLLRKLGAEGLTGLRLRRVNDGQGCHPMLDWQFVLRPAASPWPARSSRGITRIALRRWLGGSAEACGMANS